MKVGKYNKEQRTQNKHTSTVNQKNIFAKISKQELICMICDILNNYYFIAINLHYCYWYIGKFLLYVWIQCM